MIKVFTMYMEKKENLDSILKNFGQIYSDFSVSKEEIALQKQDIEQKLLRKKSDWYEYYSQGKYEIFILAF